VDISLTLKNMTKRGSGGQAPTITHARVVVDRRYRRRRRTHNRGQSLE